jgi:hypothetical protein
MTTRRTVINERFTTNDNTWPHEPTGPAQVTDGAYRLAITEPGQFLRIRPALVEVLSDVNVTGVFRKVSGPPGGGYGIVVRDQVAGAMDIRDQTGRFYVFEVGDRGEIGAWRRDGDQWIDLVSWTSSAAVQSGQDRNELMVTAVGQQMTFAVNGTTVMNVSDATLAEGSVGIFVGGDFNTVSVESFVVEELR